MKEELLITKREGHILSVRVEDGRVAQIQADPLEDGNLLGNIYVGKVRNIVKNINAAFVEFQKGQMGYLPLDTPFLPIHTDGVPYQPGRVLIGDEIIVQVTREAVKTKPPTLSGRLELAGRYVVLVATGEYVEKKENIVNQSDREILGNSGKQSVSVSRKIREKETRERIKAIIGEYCTAEYGFVARTNSASVAEAVLRGEIEGFVKQYQDMMRYGKHKVQFSLLKQAPRGHLSQIRDSDQNRLEKIITDDDGLYQEIQDYIRENGWTDSEIVQRWNPEHGKMDAVYNISKTLEHALIPKVWLKHGGYLVIQPTEALVSIDVNTGKAVSKKKNVQQTFRKTNLEAAEEIARQLRLRNLSGMILIDFIDMESKQDQQDIMDVLREEVSRDPVQTTVVDMTKLGLVEVTRKKIRKSLFEQLRTK